MGKIDTKVYEGYGIATEVAKLYAGKEIEEIHESLVNGRRHKMAEQIDRLIEDKSLYAYEFFGLYHHYLNLVCEDTDDVVLHYVDATVSYMRIKLSPDYPS